MIRLKLANNCFIEQQSWQNWKKDLKDVLILNTMIAGTHFKFVYGHGLQQICVICSNKSTLNHANSVVRSLIKWDIRPLILQLLEVFGAVKLKGERWVLQRLHEHDFVHHFNTVFFLVSQIMAFFWYTNLTWLWSCKIFFLLKALFWLSNSKICLTLIYR